LVKASHALLDRPRTGFNVEGVLGDFPGDAWHLYRAPRKYILVASEEIGEHTFLFRVQTSPDLHGLGRVFGTDVYDLGVLVRLENA
jgi:hypothetical protein